MKRGRAQYLLLILALILFLSGFVPRPQDKDTLYQASTIDALLDGLYDGDVTFGELKKHGNFGIGTFDYLDGEMIALDGEFYQVKMDGKVYPVDGKMETPFAVVTFFEPDNTIVLNGELDLKQLEAYLDKQLPSKNIFYAIRIDGTFKYIKARSVPRQEEPFPPLVDVVKEQAIFEFQDIEGTVVGFWCPAYVKGVNVPGYHLHFINKERTAGGHLLDCRTETGKIGIDHTSDFFMELPENEEFLTADLTEEKEEELKKVER